MTRRLAVLSIVVTLCLAACSGDDGGPAAPAEPVLALTATSHDFGASGSEWSFGIVNDGGGELAWVLGDAPAGITAAPPSGTAGTETDTVTVVLDRGSYAAGTYTLSLTVTSDGGDATVALSFEQAVGVGPTNLFFLHHSTGRNLIAEGDVRTHLAQTDATLEFWDHDYNYIGLSDPDGELTGTSYDIPNDNTDPDGLYTLWTTDNTARALILANHEVIAFKSCYPASDIGSEAELAQYKTWYRAIRDVLDTRTDRVFVVMSPPPRHRLATDADDAARARAFADWLGGDEFLDGHPNLVYFDLFDALAGDDDMLNYDYERSHTDSDSHPNAAANAAVGPLFAEALAAAAGVDP